MIYLPDVNVWIALTVSGHVHHRAATEWFAAADGDAVSFCRVTQMGFLRLLTNERVMGADVLAANRAWSLMEGIRRNDQVLFSPEPSNLERAWQTSISPRAKGANFWTNTYLAAFAVAAGHTLVTFDNGFRKYKDVPVRILSPAAR